MITDENGNIAIRYYQTLPHVVGVGSDSKKTEYAFVVRNNICLAWIKPEHQTQILGITKQCCGGNRKSVYFLAEQRHIDIWNGLNVR